MPLKAHAHAADGIFTALRIAKEFNVKITLEHVNRRSFDCRRAGKRRCDDGSRVTLTHATKFELRNKSWITPRPILSAAGCHVSIITDSPVIPQQYLPLCAGMAVKAGMDPFEALKAITIHPAEHLVEFQDRVGSIEEGKDADLVITDGDPFEGVQQK